MVIIMYAAIHNDNSNKGVQQGQTEGCSHDQWLIPPIVNPLSFSETLHQWQTLIAPHSPRPDTLRGEALHKADLFPTQFLWQNSRWLC